MTISTDNQEFRALVVDDDPIVCQTVSFALQHEGFVCDSARDGEQATELLGDEHFDLLVTDLRMPNKHGHALATDVLAGESRPKIIVHTSVDDPRLTKDLIVRGVDDVVFKPTNYAAFAAKAMGLVIRARKEQEEKHRVALMAEKKGRGNSKEQSEEEEVDSPIGLAEMKAKLSDVSKVLPVSRATADVCNLVQSSAFDAEQVAAAVERDPALAAKVLQLANNPFYNSTGKRITDIKQAVTRVGQKRVGEIALAMSAFASQTSGSLPWMDLDLTWERSVAAGIAVELLVAAGGHESRSSGLLFSALMHSCGRIVLGTLYPRRYEVMVKTCAANNETLLQQEQVTFPENHAEVMCSLLADWNIPSDAYRPLKHILNDYPSLSRLSEPMRTQVELVKLAVLIGRLAVGRWETWDRVEFPPSRALGRLGIESVRTIIEQTQAQLRGITNFRTNSARKAARISHAPLPSRQLAYCDLSEEPFDFLAEVVASMDIRVNQVESKTRKLRGRLLVNRIGAVPERSTSRIFRNCDEVVFVRDAEKMKYVGRVGTNIAVPCSYAALRAACWNAAGEPQTPGKIATGRSL